ncbi:hypothetical protein NARC_210040 [Candidatus Nitrosocosmicus arcticus]|uniref:Uncharacterized protein n=1 Tax=Candidatus Nitrosocosmicus arcticus TaxID=2035267 RepID=A0A557SR63_9ARCH|nr:hypothetical protein NARC_210040 [Candidatus Nitrosocosmicus arcticus]
MARILKIGYSALATVVFFMGNPTITIIYTVMLRIQFFRNRERNQTNCVNKCGESFTRQ